jgi:hypothetical protein
LRNPRQLALQFMDKLFDALRCGERFFVLKLRQGGLVFLKRKIDFDQRADHQGSTDQEHNWNCILEEKASTAHQKITSDDFAATPPLSVLVLTRPLRSKSNAA